jgi:hypothetical protein
LKIAPRHFKKAVSEAGTGHLVDNPQQDLSPEIMTDKKSMAHFEDVKA